MSSNQGRSLINPLVQSKMEGAIGTIIPPGLPKADSLSHYSHDKSLPIPRGYFSYSLNGQDALDLNCLWDSPKTCVRNGSSPGIHPSATEGIYRPENISFSMDAGGRPVGPQELAAKQRLAYYANSPRHHSPRAAGVISPVAAPKGHIRVSGISSTDGEGCVGLAVPKPVYGHSPCCTERGCTAGHTYADEHGPHRMSPRVYEDEWAAHFNRLAYLHKKGQEALAQQRVLHLERSAEGIPLKDGKTVGYHGIRSNGPGRSLPLMEPSHSSYTYNTTHPFIGSTSEYCQRAPVPLQIHRGLSPGYDPRTLTHHSVSSKVYQDRPHISKYTQMPPCSSVYYPQSQMEAYRADPNVVTDDHARQHHMAHFHSPRQNLTNMPTSCPVVPPHHPLIPKFPTYPVYGVRLNSNQTSLHEKQCSPIHMHQSERPLDFSVRRVQTPDSPRELCRQSGTPGAFHPTPGHYRRLNSTATERSEGAGTGFVGDGCKDFTNIPKSHEELLKKRNRGETESGSVVDASSKKQKTETASERPDEPQSPSVPPMPVINKVFSLAPYKIYFEATGMLPSQGNSKSPQADPTQLKQEPNIQSRDIEANSGENDLSPKPEASPANSNGLFGVDEIVKIKKEKPDPDETAYQSDMKVCVIEEINHSSVKEEQGELDSSISGSVPDHIVIKSDVEEDSNPPIEEKSESSACKTEHPVENGVGSDPVPTLPSTPPVQPPLTKFSLDKIPLHCLKLSNYKIVIPEVLKAPVSQPVVLPQSPVEAKPTASSKQARHQFMELHQSLCRLMYTFVTRTPCQELRDWLCKMDLRESVSHSSKAQRVSCLIGSKIREVWLKSEEMVMTLQKVVFQLQTYIESHRCPFPHVMRAGTVFIPMLVVKEVLFPQVQGAFIDQVLQEHRVELRPTTLSEERQLTQLHRKAFSSKLRRLLSLKHLPDIYPDVLNLLYYASVCKYLDSTATDGVQKLPRGKNQLNMQEREYGQLR